ncbi:PspC domain-containing protein [Brevibacillus sp. SYSU BS000544]|uniref:PspC domain-containing protein n=1 Tax=Brevibacillus sp. SYSU BS000544 TaxID=3416443 RepID=UPI003CE59878
MRLYRSRTDKKVFGVCGGLAQTFGIDPTLVRLATVLVIIFTGVPLLLYFLMAIIMPKEPLFSPYSMDKDLFGHPYAMPAGIDLDRDIDRIEKRALQEEIIRLRAELAKWKI